MAEYKNIVGVDTLDDGSMTVFMKNGRNAIIRIVKLNEKFEAAIYGMFAGVSAENESRKEPLLVRLEKFDVYKDCAKDALGWVDENIHDDFVPEEIKEFK